MYPDNQDVSFLWDMLNASRTVCEFVSGKTFEDYLNNRLLRSAVERQIEIIGEAARNVSQSFQDCHPEIPWQRIIAQRHVLAHEYGEIKHERIWALVTVHILRLIELLHPIVPPPPE